MESSASYLHKKFKKQLNIESRINNNNEKPHQPQQLQKQQEQQKEGAESGKEKSAPTENECSTNKITERTTTRRDNNNSVPNQSTNQNINNFVLQTKSSISIANIQSNSCISVSTSSTSNSGNNHSQNDFVYFDNSKFNSSNSEPTVTSSILNNSTNHKRNEDLSTDNLTSVDKNSTQQQQQSGKYVCNYCSLVCSKPSVLQKHIRAHTNERPYPCISCGFSFKTRSNLYKHCRSRAHANRVMGNKIVQEGDEVIVEEQLAQQQQQLQQQPHQQQLHQPVEFVQEIKTKPYKPRFHTGFKENEDKDDSVKNNPTSDLLSHHINEIISKNNSIVNSSDPYLLKKRPNDVLVDNNDKSDEPLNLTNKNRKRCMSEVVEPVAQKSLIKELLLKNLYSDMQCPYCKMIFQTVTELELHKLRSCKGFVRPSEKYSRSSSVNVASILTHNKNAFDNIPHLQYTMFPMKSPGPFLGKTRLVESDKSKSFSFEDVLPPTNLNLNLNNSDRLLSPLTLSNDKRAPVKLFGGEVKITHNTGETKSFKIDTPEQENFNDYNCKLSENRVIKSSLQSGGTVLTNKAANYAKDNHSTNQDVIRVYENTSLSPSIDISSLTKPKFNFDSSFKVTSTSNVDPDVSYKYTNIVDFSQKAIKMLTPNIKQPSIIPPIHLKPNKFAFEPAVPPPKDPIHDLTKEVEIVDLTRKEPSPKPFMNPMNLYVNGKVVRYVPGMPGPVLDVPINMTTYKPPIQSPVQRKLSPVDPLEIKTDLTPPPPPPPNKSPNSLKDKQVPSSPVKKFARPNSLALKPTTASLKQHHGLTPTMFNQILISPDTPRVAKKYVHQFLHGNYFSYLGLKSSTKPVYCTLNKTQPFYVPHFKKLSMYSEWRQQDTKADKLYVSAYDSRQKHQRYTTAGKVCADLVVHSSYKFIVSDTIPKGDRLNEDHQKPNMILGGYESNEDYTYIRGRGRGRYVCDQCGIRCKKPSMLKKHIRTHSNDRPYTCNHCNFSFKTKGNLTKHMKSKAHTKNYAASGSSSSSTQLSGTQSSESDTDDSGMDSSDESTRREEHEAAYGLLSLSQKPSQISPTNPQPSSTSSAALQESYVMDTEEIVQISKTTYAKNKILDEKNFSAPKNIDATTIQQHTSAMKESKEVRNFIQFLGKTTTNRPLTYPYTSIPPDLDSNKGDVEDKEQPKSIKQFHVIQKYAPSLQSPNKSNGEWEREVFIDKNLIREKVQQRLQLLPVVKVNDVVVYEQLGLRKRKSAPNNIENFKDKMQKSDEVIDLSMANDKERFNGSPLTLNPDEESHSKKMLNNEVYSAIKYDTPPKKHFINEDDYQNYKNNDYNKSLIKNNGNVLVLAPLPEPQPQPQYIVQEENKTYKEFDNSAMETLADIATKQVKLEKNTLAKSVASEYLKLATKNEYNNREDQQCCQNVDELIVKPEGSKSCSICSKSFSKPSQLRLHMNIHYLERPFRCDSCSVSFRTKGHLQKHERSASHHNKLSSSPALSSSEPRPFKCVDCNIAFRIHGHLAKHLRSKMHIMKLECLAKIPFGLYAELERSNSLLTEINTSDGDQCLKSLKTLAKKVFVNDPNKLNQLETVEPLDVDS